MRVLIVGAGVAGSTLARALTQVGISARLFDSAPSRFNGLPRGLGLWKNSQSCLEDIGLGDFLHAEACFVPPAAYRDVKGSWLSGCSDLPANLRRVACVEQNRLLAALQDAADLDISWGKKVVEISGVSSSSTGASRGVGRDRVAQTPRGPVVLTFADGERVEGDLVVGADGANSVVRRTMFNDAVCAPGHSLFAMPQLPGCSGSRAKIRNRINSARSTPGRRV